MGRGEESRRGSRRAGAPEPNEIDSVTSFVAALRGLRTWCGLTYRQLEGKAAADGNVLPSSTIATTLGRATLPREPFVGAFTRACGLDEDEVNRWLDARRRIAVGQESQTDGATAPEAAEPVVAPPVTSQRRHSTWQRRSITLVAGVGAGVAGTLGAMSGLDRSSNAPIPDPVPGLRLLAVGSWARIQPARTPELCVTEGRDRTQRYGTAVAVQRPCDQSTLPHVYIRPLDHANVQIQWHHPKYGIGCLTVLLDGPGRDLIEPRDDCAEDDPAQRFRIEPVGPPHAGRFRIRPDATDECLALRDQDTVENAEIVQGRCSGARDQEFLIELIPPG
ncbi:hypothetical protein DFR76_101881 [Nocardia pseudobrasiliensis]|uniref:Ricin-type beta-trefoil lectin protein n=1 Tax=Nocardia pseudobrasiliensis TaxID=45979 RepID=A0A370IF73_9NOCA|nr:hypothetical protein DFR76_101881 [Nocardia pseudobrasiliensis]